MAKRVVNPTEAGRRYSREAYIEDGDEEELLKSQGVAGNPTAMLDAFSEEMPGFDAIPPKDPDGMGESTRARSEIPFRGPPAPPKRPEPPEIPIGASIGAAPTREEVERQIEESERNRGGPGGRIVVPYTEKPEEKAQPKPLAQHFDALPSVDELPQIDWDARLQKARGQRDRDEGMAGIQRGIENFASVATGYQPDRAFSDSLAARSKHRVEDVGVDQKIDAQKRGQAAARPDSPANRAFQMMFARQFDLDPVEVKDLDEDTLVKLAQMKRQNADLDLRQLIEQRKSQPAASKPVDEEMRGLKMDVLRGQLDKDRARAEKDRAIVSGTGAGLTAEAMRGEKLERQDVGAVTKQLAPLAEYLGRWKDLESDDLAGRKFLRGDSSEWEARNPGGDVSLPASNMWGVNRLVDDKVKAMAQKVSSLIIDERHDVFGASLSPGEKEAFQQLIDNSISQGPRALAISLNTIRRKLGDKLRARIASARMENPEIARKFIQESGIGEKLGTFDDVIPAETYGGPFGQAPAAAPAQAPVETPASPKPFNPATAQVGQQYTTLNKKTGQPVVILYEGPGKYRVVQ